MDTKNVVYWEGPGEYTPVPALRPGYTVWCLAMNALAAIRLISQDHAAKLGKVVVIQTWGGTHDRQR